MSIPTGKNNHKLDLVNMSDASSQMESERRLLLEFKRDSNPNKFSMLIMFIFLCS